jgi:uncharacterized protein YigE (DUF2233 family)
MRKENKRAEKVKRVPLYCFFILFPLLAAQGGHSYDEFPWQKIEEGFEFKAAQIDGQPYQSLIKLKVLRVGLEKFQVRVLDTRVYGTDRLEIRLLAKKAQALAAINGGFFTPEYRPLGLLIVDGKEVNPLRRADWGVFLIQENRPRIIHTNEFQNDRNISQAMQVGPRLVVNGRELQMKRQAARRSALGVTMKYQLILLSTDDTDVYAQDLARIFHLPESQGGLECRDAMVLDGGPSAQMYAEYKDLKIDIPGGWGVPNGIGVFKRKP